MEINRKNERLAELKRQLEDVVFRRACKEGTNVMPVLIDAVDTGVTLGEVSDIYREVFGVYTDPGML